MYKLIRNVLCCTCAKLDLVMNRFSTIVAEVAGQNLNITDYMFAHNNN